MTPEKVEETLGEFDRGNPAQALGEMLTLLEHTKRSVREASS